ncbi:hypothetical protein X798_07368, partial [Onchocerca flexuosa]
FRRIRLVHDVLTITSACEERSEVIVDSLLEYNGWESYENDATSNLLVYFAHIKALMDNYGIQDEGQLFSGCISKIRNRISDRDTDDMSQFNTNFIIEQKLTNIFMSFRQSFFEEFGGLISCTQPDDDFRNKDVIERRYCKCPTVEMKKKASAYYITDEIPMEDSDEIHDLNNLIGGVGKCFLRFLQYLSSRSFETMKIFNFMRPNLGYHSVLMRGQWFDLHQAAVKTFYQIVLTSRFDELSVFQRKQISANNSSFHSFIEAEPFTIELPEDLRSHDENLKNKLIRYSGVHHLYLRRIPDKKSWFLT